MGRHPVWVARAAQPRRRRRHWEPQMRRGDDKLFDLSELRGVRAIGEGASSVVYAGSWRGHAVAVKVLRARRGARVDAECARERAAHARLRHPNIVALYGRASCAGARHALVFQHCAGGELDVARIASFDVALRVAHDVARALAYAHARGVMHRDVKPSQVLLDNGRALLGDWGLAAAVGSAECTVGETGTWEFMAPEVIDMRAPYGCPADVFSFGVLLWCLLAREPFPYDDEYMSPEQAARCVAAGALRPRRLARLGRAPELWELMEMCWAQNPRDRPTMNDVLDALLVIRANVLKRQRSRSPQRRSWGAGWGARYHWPANGSV